MFPGGTYRTLPLPFTARPLSQMVRFDVDRDDTIVEVQVAIVLRYTVRDEVHLPFIFIFTELPHSPRQTNRLQRFDVGDRPNGDDTVWVDLQSNIWVD